MASSKQMKFTPVILLLSGVIPGLLVAIHDHPHIQIHKYIWINREPFSSQLMKNWCSVMTLRIWYYHTRHPLASVWTAAGSPLTPNPSHHFETLKATVVTVIFTLTSMRTLLSPRISIRGGVQAEITQLAKISTKTSFGSANPNTEGDVD